MSEIEKNLQVFIKIQNRGMISCRYDAEAKKAPFGQSWRRFDGGLISMNYAAKLLMEA